METTTWREGIKRLIEKKEFKVLKEETLNLICKDFDSKNISYDVSQSDIDWTVRILEKLSDDTLEKENKTLRNRILRLEKIIERKSKETKLFEKEYIIQRDLNFEKDLIIGSMKISNKELLFSKYKWGCSFCNHHTHVLSMHCQGCNREGGYSTSSFEKFNKWHDEFGTSKREGVI